MASIDKRPNGTWRARWREYPGGPQKTRAFPRKVDAQDFLDELRTQQRTGTYAPPAAGRETFGSWWARWRAGRQDLRESTAVRDDTYYRVHIEPTFGPVPLGSIDRHLVRTWMAGMVDAGLAPKTVRHAVGLVRQALQAAVDEPLIAANPAARLTGMPEVVAGEMRIATPAEVHRLHDVIDPRYRTWLAVMAYSGLRLGESVALARKHVDLDQGRIRVVSSTTEVRGKLVTGPPKTKAGRRHVPLPAPVVELLAEQCDGLADGDLVFTAPEGGPIRRGLFRSRVWIPAAIAAGVGERVVIEPAGDGARRRSAYRGMRIHDLRHTAVSLWIHAGANVKQLTTWAGHESVATLLDRYGHLLPEAESPVMGALGDLFTDAQTPAVRAVSSTG